MSWNLRFTVPGVPTLERARNRMGFMKESQERRYWREMVSTHIPQTSRPPDPLEFAYIHIDVYRKSDHEPDRINLLHSLKTVVDALEPTKWRRKAKATVPSPILGAAIIIEDSPAHLDGGQYWATWHGVETKEEQKMEIFVEEVDPKRETWRFRNLTERELDREWEIQT